MNNTNGQTSHQIDHKYTFTENTNTQLLRVDCTKICGTELFTATTLITDTLNAKSPRDCKERKSRSKKRKTVVELYKDEKVN